MGWKDLTNQFRDLDLDKKRVLPARVVQQILTRFDIDMPEEQFGTACAKLGLAADGGNTLVPYIAFLQQFRFDKEEEDDEGDDDY